MRRGFHSSSRRLARILAADGVDDSCVRIFRSRGHEVDHLKNGIMGEELIKAVQTYDGIVVRSSTKLKADSLAHATKLKIIGRAGVGVDNIDVQEATRRGIMVMNTPGGNTVSTAQLTLTMLACLARNIPAADMSIKENKWDRKSFTGVEMGGKTIGIIGCGRIGQVVAQVASGFGMKVLGYDFAMSANDLKEAGIQPASMDEIWKNSDFVTVHTPLTAETKGLLNDETIAKCKPGVRIINCARGGIVDEDALLRGLKSGHVAGAALDVFTTEPPHSHLQELLAHPNLICTPHLGASTEEAQINVARDIANQMCDSLDGKSYVGVLNVNYLGAASQKHMKPFMILAELLGSAMAQLNSSPIKHVDVRTFGGRDVSITSPQAQALLKAIVLKGVMKNVNPASNPDVISAPFLAQELGITSNVSLVEPNSATTAYWNIIDIEVTCEDGTKGNISGSVFGDVPHIVQLGKFSSQFAFNPEGKYMLAFQNENKLGVIGEVLNVLQGAKINIASSSLSKPQTIKGVNGNDVQASMCFICLDNDVPDSLLSAIRSLPYMHNVAKMQIN